MSTDTAKTPPFSRHMTFRYGVLEQVSPGLRRIVCHNPGAFTFKGTNLYVVGEGEVAVVDPGPVTSDQLDVLADALQGERVTHIVLTHCHGDHSGAVAALKERTGAITCGMPRVSQAAKSPTERSFVIPVAFDTPLGDGGRVAGKGWELEAIHTPGHAPDHLCFALAGRDILLSGDHVMGWNTSVVAPPEGHMGSYMRALQRLMDRSETLYFPGHGGPVREPQRFVKALIFHRHWRESEIADCLRNGVGAIKEIVPRIYPGIEPALLGAAAMSVYAQLEFMVEKNVAATVDGGAPALNQIFVLT